MGGHIRIDKDLEDDPRVAPLAEAVLRDWIARGLPESCKDDFRRNARNAVIGSLLALWRYADTYLCDGDLLHTDVHELSRVTGASVAVLRSFPSTWLRFIDDHTISLPDYTAKNALLTKELRRDQNRIRQQRFRDNVASSRNANSSRSRNARNAPSRAPARARTGTGPTRPGPYAGESPDDTLRRRARECASAPRTPVRHNRGESSQAQKRTQAPGDQIPSRARGGRSEALSQRNGIRPDRARPEPVRRHAEPGRRVAVEPGCRAGRLMTRDLFRQLELEAWLSKRMREHGVDLFAGDTDTDKRREHARAAIRSAGLETIVIGPTAAGKAETYADAFERIYGQPLDPKSKTKRGKQHVALDPA